MAEEFAVVVVEKVVEKLIDPIIRQFSYMFFYKNNVKRLTLGVEDLQKKKSDVTLSVDAHNRNLQIIGQDVVSWLAEVEENGKRAHTILEGTKIVEGGCLNGWCPSLKQRYVVSRKAVKHLVLVKELQTNGEKYTQMAYPALPIGTVASVSTHPTEVFESRISLTRKVIQALKNEDFMMIGVCGLGGVGKTTMVKEIRDRAIAENLCVEVAMAVATENPNLKKMQDELASMLGLELDEKNIVDVRGKRLCERLMKGKRTLIILDDVWNNLDLAELGIPIGVQLGSKGCKILITSRNEHVCTAIGTNIIFSVNLLSSTEAWDLFKEKAAIVHETGDLYNIANEVSKECGGLPLAIVTVATALKGKEKYEWQDALKQLQMSNVTSIPGMENNVYARLRLSYNLLESNQLRRLFLLCCTYPEDYEIPVEELVRYSIGLRVLKDVFPLESVRQRVKSLVNQLKRCYLLLDGNKSGHVKVHDVLRDFGLKEASHGEHVFFVRGHAELEHCMQNGITEHCTEISIASDKMLAYEHNTILSGLVCPLLQSLTLRFNGSLEIPVNHFGGMKELSVVSFHGQMITFTFEGVFHESPQIPLQVFTNMRTLLLDYCWAFFDIEYIGFMKKLEVLSFFGSKSVKVLPNEIGQLVNLKLLDLRGCEVGLIMPGVLSSLKKLEDLYMGDYFSGKEVEMRKEGSCASVIELNSLSALKTLQISISRSEVFSKLNEFSFDKLVQFDIIIDFKWKRELVYDFPNCVAITSTDLSHFTWDKIGPLFRNSEVLRLEYVTGLENLIGESDEIACMDLKELTLIRTNDMVKIFHGSLPAGLTAGKLEAITLKDLPAMRNIWSGQVNPSSFENLKIFNLEECNSIQNLFSESVASCLVQLETLYISNCEMLENIVFKDETQDNGRAKLIGFIKLKEVSLFGLPNLKNFLTVSDISGSVERMSFPSMENLKLRKVNATMIVVHETKTGSRIHQLKYLDILICDRLSCITSTFDDTNTLRKLVHLSIKSSDVIETVFDLKGIELSDRHDSAAVILGELVSVYLASLKGLRHIWRNFPKHGLIHRTSFQKLEVLEVSFCHQLKYIFSPLVAKLLVNLRVLHIRYCWELEQVILFEEEEGEDHETEKKMIGFPKLRELTLVKLISLKNFVTYANGSDHSHNGSLFTKLISLPSLETLHLDHMDAIKIVFDLKQIGSFDHKMTKDDDELRGMGGVSFDGTKLFPNLRSLKVKSCNSIETVFDLERVDDSKEVIFGELEIIELESLDELRHIWMHSPMQGLNKLKKLQVNICNKLKYMFSASTTTLLLNLQILQVANCNMMEQVMMIEEEEMPEVEKKMDTVLFPHLHYVQLAYLENLISFYMGSCDLEFSSLVSVLLDDCPNMANFCLKSASTPRLKSVEYGYEKVWDGDLNNTVRQIKQRSDDTENK